MFCADCGAELPRPGYDKDGIRDYFVPGDPPWRRHSELVKVKWLGGRSELSQCPNCCFVGDGDSFDVMGADEGNLFCNQCGCEFEDVPLEVFKPPQEAMLF